MELVGMLAAGRWRCGGPKGSNGREERAQRGQAELRVAASGSRRLAVGGRPTAILTVGSLG